jgi:hypothetical protein
MEDETTRELISAVRQVYVAEGDIVLVESNRPESVLNELNPLYQQLKDVAGREPGPSVHVCQGTTCGLPLKTSEQVAEALAI